MWGIVFQASDDPAPPYSPPRYSALGPQHMEPQPSAPAAGPPGVGPPGVSPPGGYSAPMAGYAPHSQPGAPPAGTIFKAYFISAIIAWSLNIVTDLSNLHLLKWDVSNSCWVMFTVVCPVSKVIKFHFFLQICLCTLDTGQLLAIRLGNLLICIPNYLQLISCDGYNVCSARHSVYHEWVNKIL